MCMAENTAFNGPKNREGDAPLYFMFEELAAASVRYKMRL